MRPAAYKQPPLTGIKVPPRRQEPQGSPAPEVLPPLSFRRLGQVGGVVMAQDAEINPHGRPAWNCPMQGQGSTP